MSEWLDMLDELEKKLRPGPWEQFGGKHIHVDAGENPQVFRHPESDEAYKEGPDHFGPWVCLMRNHARELIDATRTRTREDLLFNRWRCGDCGRDYIRHDDKQQDGCPWCKILGALESLQQDSVCECATPLYADNQCSNCEAWDLLQALGRGGV